MRPFVNARVVLLCFAVGTMLAAGARASTMGFQFRLSDPTGQIRTQVTAADVLRPTARATLNGAGGGTLYFRLTDHGVAKFRVLTRELAHRGARLHERQGFDFAVNGKVYGRPLVDYRAYPQGLDAESGIKIRMQLSVARMLAQAIRGG